MDPLSIIASVITTTGVTLKGLEKLKTLYDAGIELHALIHEVSDLGDVLQEVERTILERRKHQHLPQHAVDSISKILKRAQDKLTLLNAIINDCLKRAYSPSGEPKVARVAWLRQKSKVKELQEDVKSIRLSLCTLWGAVNLADVSWINSRLDEVVVLHQSHLNQLSEQRRCLEYLSEHILRPQPVSNTSKNTEALAKAVSYEAQTGNRRSRESSVAGLPVTSAQDLSIKRQYSLCGKGDKDKTDNSVRSHPLANRRSSCEVWCSCVCHPTRYIRSPPGVGLLFGSMFIGYSGFPYWNGRCNSRKCRRQSNPLVKVNYYLPQWLLERAIHFAVSLTYMNGPQISLSMPRVIDGNADIFSFAVQGDLNGIISLFSQGLASPYDVASSTGRSPLHYAVNYNHQEVAQFFLNQGADPNLEDKEQASTVTIAWNRILGNLASSSTIDAWHCMFDGEDHLESRAYPSLHKIIFGQSRIDLRQQLELSTSTIDDKDSDGRTALSWASTRGDTEAVNLLLEFGTDPNVCSGRGQSPLHWAAQCHTLACSEILQALLNSDADVNCVDYYQRTALIYASCCQDDPACLKPLIRRGADLNAQDCHKRTPLGYAARMGKSETLKLLLSCGADHHISDSWGVEPLFEAVRQNYHHILQALLQRDVNPTSRAANGMSFQHLAALYGDVETLHILAKKKFKTTYVDGNSGEYSKLQDLFQQRDDVGPEIEEAFRSWIQAGLRIDVSEYVNDVGTGGYIEADKAECFTDAVEYQA